jgi:sugar phosphate isomerase/epimerase
MFGSATTRDTVRVLTTVADAGATAVEPMFNLAPKASLLRVVTEDLGLHVAAAHVFWWDVFAQEAAVIHYCLQADARRLIVSHLPAGSAAEYRRVARQLRVWAAHLEENGIRLLLHNQVEEASPASDDARPALEILRDELGDTVGLCFDLHRASPADVAPVIGAWSDRCDYYHLQDRVLGAEAVDLGRGSINLRSAFARIPPAPDAYLVAERTVPPADPLRACSVDVAFLLELAAAEQAAAPAR